MKKLAAILCASAMMFGTVQAVTANPDVDDIHIIEITEQVNIAEDSKFTSESLKGKTILIKKSTPEDYEDRNENIAKAVEMLLDEETTYKTQELKETVGVEFVKDRTGHYLNRDGDPEEFRTTKDNYVDPTRSEPLTSFSSFVDENGDFLEEGQIEAVVSSCEALVGKNKNHILIIQLNERVLNGTATDLRDDEEAFYLIELEDFDPETGGFRAQFPCMGPFIIVETEEAITSEPDQRDIASPSIGNVNVIETQENVNIVEESEYTSENLRDKIIPVKRSEAEDYENRNADIATAIEMLLDPEHTYTTQELVQTVIGAEAAAGTFLTENGTETTLADLEPVTTFSSFIDQEGNLLEEGRLEAVIPSCETLIGVDPEDIIIVQYDEQVLADVEAGLADPADAVHLIEVDAFDAETGGFTAKFPCTGPFFVTLRTTAE